jgi:O-antigen/teichoic acid export membrane protein
MFIKSKSPVWRRLAHGSGANLAGKIWVLLVQLISVPVMTRYWGLDGYGIWLMISTIPTYLALSDFGLATAAGIDITAAVTRDDKHAALKAFQSVWAFLTAVTIVVGVFVVSGALIWIFFGTVDADGLLNGSFSAIKIATTICLITISALITMQMSIRKIIFQATHKYALGTALFDGLYFLSSVAVLVCVLLGGDIVWAAGAQLGSRLISFVIFAAVQKRLEPWIYAGTNFVERATLKRLLEPSIAALALTVANSFGLQGVVLTIGWAFNPAAAAIFSTSRMLTRIPMQFSGLVTRASLPELTRAQIAGNTDLTKRLMKLNIGLALAVMAPAALVLSVFGPQILAYMSHEQMETGSLTFVLLGLAASFCAVWTTLGTRLIAVNRQGEYSYVALGLYFACTLVPFASGGSMIPVLIAIVCADAVIALRTVGRD